LSTIETVLIFVGIPVAVALVVTGLVYAGGGRRNKRYRPGRPFEFRAVWFLSVPEQLSASQAALAAGEAPPAQPAEESAALAAARAARDAAQQGATGGASDRW
jgi:hypothetical protein